MVQFVRRHHNNWDIRSAQSAAPMTVSPEWEGGEHELSRARLSSLRRLKKSNKSYTLNLHPAFPYDLVIELCRTKREPLGSTVAIIVVLLTRSDFGTGADSSFGVHGQMQLGVRLRK